MSDEPQKVITQRGLWFEEFDPDVRYLHTIVANLGFSEVAFPRPLFHGDTTYAETVVTDKRESKSRAGEGIEAG